MRGLIEEARLSPIDAANRVIVLDESHMLTKVAQNVLLKTLEEGVGQTVIILVTTDPDKLLPTIRSRCVRVSLVPVDRLTVVKHLMTITKKEGVEAEEDALKLIVENTYGHIRDALNITQQMSLAGPLTLEVTKKHLNLHLDELVANIILTSGESWTNAVDELNITVQENPPEEIWSSMRRSVVQAALLNLSPVKETLNNIIPQIAETYGPRLLSSSEWVLGEGSRLQIRTLSDLTIALAILREKLGANLKVKVQGVKRLGMPKEKRDHRRKPVHMKPEEMKESLLLIPDDSQQETSTDFTSSAEHF
jgi:DNA polymerase III delta prime subunit